MWKCKHCVKEFNFLTISEKANHSRWCDKNPRRNDTESLKIAQQKIVEKNLGKLKDFSVICFNCKSTIIVNEREKQHPTKEKYFCSRSCANSQGGKGKSDSIEMKHGLTYRALAKKI